MHLSKTHCWLLFLALCIATSLFAPEQDFVATPPSLLYLSIIAVDRALNGTTQQAPIYAMLKLIKKVTNKNFHPQDAFFKLCSTTVSTNWQQTEQVLKDYFQDDSFDSDLLSYQAKKEEKDYFKKTFLYLIDQGADPRGCTANLHDGRFFSFYDKNAFHLLAFAGNVTGIEILCSYFDQKRLQYDLNLASGSYQYTPLHCAIINQHFSMVKWLVEHNVDVNSTNHYGQSPLFLAVITDTIEIVQYLMEHAKGIKTSWANNETPLHKAAVWGYEKIVKYLIATQPQWIHATTNCGWTPLHYAAVGNKKQIISLLLAHGANPCLKTHEGRTAYDYATERGLSKTAQLLK